MNSDRRPHTHDDEVSYGFEEHSEQRMWRCFPDWHYHSVDVVVFGIGGVCHNKARDRNNE